jgi:hypothetical protein
MSWHWTDAHAGDAVAIADWSADAHADSGADALAHSASAADSEAVAHARVRHARSDTDTERRIGHRER